MKLALQISMDYLESGVEEAKTLLDAYDISYSSLKRIERILIVEIPELNPYNHELLNRLKIILDRSATIKRGLLVFNEFQDELTKEKIYSDELAEIISKFGKAAIHIHYFKPVKLSSSNLKTVIDMIYTVLFKDFKGKILLSNPDLIVSLYNVYNHYWIGVEIYDQRKRFEWRRAKYRPVFSPFALHPKLSRLMINLSGAKEGDIIVDPFCGVGSTSMESTLLGIENICIELWYKWAFGCLKNMKWIDNSLKLINIVNADSLSPILRWDDLSYYIVTDPPYGRITSTGKYDVTSIYRVFIDKYITRAKSSVFFSPREIDDLLINQGLIISFKNIIPVHSSLTRYLYVVRGV